MALLGFNSCTAVDGFQALETFDVFHQSTGTLGTMPGRYTGNCLVFPETGFDTQWGGYSIANQATIIQGSDVQSLTTVSDFGYIFHIMQGGTSQIALKIESSGAVSAYTGATLVSGGGTLLGTSSSTPIVANQWFHIEWKVFIDPTSGTVQIKVNNATVLNLTGVNTQTTINNYADLAIIHHAELGSAFILFDNPYVMDGTGSAPYNDFIGPQNVTCHLAISNGSNIAWTPLAAPNFSQINESIINGSYPYSPPTPDGDISYNFSINSASDLIDTFSINGFSAMGENNAIQVSMFARSTVASGTRQIKATLYKGSSLYKGSTFNVTSTSYQFFIDKTSFLLVDPASSSPWIAALGNSYEWGYTNVGNGIMDGTDVYISQLKIERMGPVSDPFVPNHPMWITG